MRLLLLLLTLITLPTWAQATREQPKWEVGVFLGMVSLPQYMGSNERYQLALPLPYFTYRSKRLKITGQGVRTYLFSNHNITLDASFGAGLPVKNGNQARTGMPNLPFTLQAGPRLNWQIHHDAQEDVRLRLPVRWTMDTSLHHVGWLFEPELLRTKYITPDWSYRLSGGALFATQRYNERFYGVPTAYATANRPAYQAQGGLHSVFLRAASYYHYDDNLFIMFASRYRNMQVGTVAHSPLVKKAHDFSLFLGVSYRFWQSDERIEDDEEE